MLVRMVDIQPGFSHFDVVKASPSLNSIPVPHNLSLLALANILDPVLFNISNSGGFCTKFSLIPFVQMS